MRSRLRRSIGPVELVVILVVAMLLFGGGKGPPDLLNRLAEGIRNFRDSLGGGGPGGPAAA
jgi:TatA/E family protein of Tat protein translocase